MVTFHRRRLPHLHAIGRPVFLAWRLHGSLPKGRWFPAELASGKAFVAMDQILDKGMTGPTFLRHPDIAQMVVEALRYRDSKHYELHAYVVMANHVHMLVTPYEELTKTMHSLKRHTARQANLMLAQTGRTFWQEESYDRLVRDSNEFKKIGHYIHMNPVQAGLVARPEDFPWSSRADWQSAAG